jgi:hypothetical protein
MSPVNYGNDVTLVPAGTVVTAAGTGTALELGNKSDVRAVSTVTAISGAGASLVVIIETSYDNGATDSWRTVATLTAQTTANTVRGMGGVDRWVRARWTLAGTTPSVTFGVSGEAV